MKKLFALPFLALVVGAVLVAITQTGGNTETTQAVALSGINVDELKAGGIELFPTSKSVQPDTLNAASEEATARFGFAAKETAVARVVSPNLFLDEVFIIANLDVTGETTIVGGVPGSKYVDIEASMLYMLVFFNPDDGSFVQSTSAAKMPEWYPSDPSAP